MKKILLLSFVAALGSINVYAAPTTYKCDAGVTSFNVTAYIAPLEGHDLQHAYSPVDATDFSGTKTSGSNGELGKIIKTSDNLTIIASGTLRYKHKENGRYVYVINQKMNADGSREEAATGSLAIKAVKESGEQLHYTDLKVSCIEL